LNGSYDNYITVYAVRVKTWGKPLFIRLGHEFNGNWYTYGGANNGGGTLDGFGDPTKADGPERFIAAYKRVHDIFESIAVDNVAWVWCPNNGSSPNESWNVPEVYYPGDSYVDWIGFDGYNFGTTQTWSGWTSFFNIYNALYQKFKTYGKPIMLGEFASVEQGGSKSQWITDAYLTWIKFGYTKIKAATWFHTAKVEGTVFTDWRINSSTASLTAYQNAIADPYFLSRVPATDVVNESVIPDYFALDQNYPNPFNPSTKIKFALPSSGNTKLNVYNIFGEKVRTLVQSYLEAGIHEMDFTADGLSSGVYLYALQFDGKQEIKKMILQK
jgi:beta-mannanase